MDEENDLREMKVKIFEKKCKQGRPRVEKWKQGKTKIKNKTTQNWSKITVKREWQEKKDKGREKQHEPEQQMKKNKKRELEKEM